MTETRTTCPYCGVGCGVVASADGEKVSIRGMKLIRRISVVCA
ncbi:assimilatory nitrate reductase (NADH) alpha subunit apoprotein [Enterobacter hormaechei]|nr:assimilatory nitrate reductase (NADH) alpha subunit apoprotein [Enterobacter hormaechei]